LEPHASFDTYLQQWRLNIKEVSQDLPIALMNKDEQPEESKKRAENGSSLTPDQ